MKKVLSALMLLTLLGFMTPQPLHAIDFEQQASWKEVLEKAQKTGQMIFVDAYATWCGPCKMMDREVFTDPAVSDFFNQHFLCVKIDMESKRGEAFGKQFEVGAYPSLFFIAPDAQLVKVNIGALSAEKLLAIGQYVLDPASSPVQALQARYDAGERDTAFLGSYLLAKAAIGESDEEATRLFILASTPEKIAGNFEYYALLYQLEFNLDSELGRYFSTHFDHFQGEYSSYSFQKLIEMLNNHLIQGVALGMEEYFSQATDYVKATVKEAEIRDELVQSIEKAKKENLKKN